MNADTIAANLALVEGHFHSERANEIEKALELYTDDIVWEGPARKVRFQGKQAVADMYRKMFASLQDVQIQHLQRFATDTHVFDDSIMTFLLVRSGMDNLPFPLGSRIELRMVHVFEVRDGKICKETTYEMFERLE
jgi:steroid delta-isomerase-like uncharacterized protein